MIVAWIGMAMPSRNSRFENTASPLRLRTIT